MPRTRHRPAAITPEAMAKKVKDWMFGDHGPFGWNDPAKFQEQFDTMNRFQQMEFITFLTPMINSGLMTKVG